VSGGEQRTVLVADTTGYLPRESVDHLGIELVSLYVTLDGVTEKETEMGDFSDFYKRLRASDGMPTTSQPSVGDFIDVYEPILSEGKEILSVHISAGLSGTHETALQAKEQLTAEGKGGERIEVFDSRSAAGGTGMIQLAGAVAARQGQSAAEALATVTAAREELKIWFAPDTLEYLRRGGRIGGAQALIGSALQIKPILTFEEEVTPGEKVRTSKKVVERMKALSEERHAAGCDGWVIQHIDDAERADALAEACREIYGCEPVMISQIGPVVGAHGGPGLLGTGSIPAKYVPLDVIR
jgi:DegV family protein with EDD domain